MKTKTDVAVYVALAIARSGKSHAQIAKESGFPRPNVLSMIKTGRTQVPLARIPAMAKALGTDPKILLDGCLAAYHPEIHRIISSLAPSCLISRGELAVIRMLRYAVHRGAIA